MSGIVLFLGTMLASGVEFVEALTVVLATGLTRGWRSSLLGTFAALLVLTAAVALLGVTLVTFIPISTLRLVVGIFLLIFGMQWLRKAILRYAGLKAMRDEAAIFVREVDALRSSGSVTGGGIDWFAFTVSFKAVLLEGLEVVFIVASFGASGDMRLAVGGAALAAVLVVLAGILLHRPLTNVPENTMKFAVGLALVTFGTFWGGEGLGIEWTLGDMMILVLLIAYLLVSWGMIQVLRRKATQPAKAGAE